MSATAPTAGSAGDRLAAWSKANLARPRRGALRLLRDRGSAADQSSTLPLRRRHACLFRPRSHHALHRPEGGDRADRIGHRHPDHRLRVPGTVPSWPGLRSRRGHGRQKQHDGGDEEQLADLDTHVKNSSASGMSFSAGPLAQRTRESEAVQQAEHEGTATARSAASPTRPLARCRISAATNITDSAMVASIGA